MHPTIVSRHYMYGQSMDHISQRKVVIRTKSSTAQDATVEYNIDSMIALTSMNVHYKPVDSLVITVVSAVPPVGRLLGINVSTPAPSLPST